MTHDLERFLRPEEIARISRLELRARKVVEGFVSGLHRSPYFGQSLEFVQHREYVPGDDIRRIDWKVWSKTDRYYIKQYQEETNLKAVFLLDASEADSIETRINAVEASIGPIDNNGLTPASIVPGKTQSADSIQTLDWTFPCDLPLPFQRANGEPICITGRGDFRAAPR